MLIDSQAAISARRFVMSAHTLHKDFMCLPEEPLKRGDFLQDVDCDMEGESKTQCLVNVDYLRSALIRKVSFRLERQ